jgi:PKD domain
LLLTIPLAVFCQGYSNQMIFGYAGGAQSVSDPEYGLNILRFTDGSIQVDNNQTGEAFFNDTNAAISDSVGNLLFYFNGIDVFNKAHKVIVSGDTLNPQQCCGYDIQQGAVILPAPAISGKYYLFYETELIRTLPNNSLEFSSNGFYCAEINIFAQNGLGEVTNRKQMLLMDTVEHGKISTVRHGNGRDWWIIVPDLKTNRIYSFLLDSKGVTLELINEVGIPRVSGAGQAHISSNGNKYVIESGLYFDKGFYLDLYDFDRCSGTVSNHQQIYAPNDTVISVGAAVSANSKYLYSSTLEKMYQYDLESADILASRTLVGTYDGFLDPFPTQFFTCFLAPDNKIYVVTTSGSRTLHVINTPDEAGQFCNFQNHGFRLDCYNNGTAPNFANYRLGPIDSSACDTLGLNNDPVSWWRYEQANVQSLKVEFTDLSYHEPADWLWTFGDGETSTEVHPIHTYLTAGVYQVCLTVSNVHGTNTHCKTLYVGVTPTENLTLQSQIKVFPNPFQGHLRVTIENEMLDGATLLLYNQLGQLVQQEQMQLGINPLATERLTTGAYYWLVRSEGMVVKSGMVVKY